METSPSERLMRSRQMGWLKAFVAFAPVCDPCFLRATWFVFLVYEAVSLALQIAALFSYSNASLSLSPVNAMGLLITIVYPLIRIALVRVFLEMAATVLNSAVACGPDDATDGR